MPLLPGIPQSLADEVTEAVRDTLLLDAPIAAFAKGGIEWRHFPELGMPGIKPRCIVSSILYRTEGRISLVETGRAVVGIYFEMERLSNVTVKPGEASLNSLLRRTINTINANGGLLHGDPPHPTIQGVATWNMIRPLIAEVDSGQGLKSQILICGVEADFRLASTLEGYRVAAP